MQLHPRAPVLARRGGAVQVGLTSPAVLRGLGSAERAFLASLEGGRPVSPIQARRFSRLVSRLTNAGAWWDAPVETPPFTVAVHGCGRLGMAIAAALADAGCDVALVDDASQAVEEAGLFPAASGEVPATCAGGAAGALAARGVRVRVGGSAALAVVTCLGSPDPTVVAELMRTDTPHVLVVCGESDAWVSHMIVPGVSACSRCRDLALSRDDDEWPLVSLQLSSPGQTGRRPFASDAARPVIAGLVCAAVGRWRGAGAIGAGYRVNDSGAFWPEPIAADPQCGCGAPPRQGSVPGDDLEDVRAVGLEL